MYHCVSGCYWFSVIRWSERRVKEVDETSERTCPSLPFENKDADAGEKKHLNQTKQQHLESVQRFNNPVCSRRLWSAVRSLLYSGDPHWSGPAAVCVWTHQTLGVLVGPPGVIVWGADCWKSPIVAAHEEETSCESENASHGGNIWSTVLLCFRFSYCSYGATKALHEPPSGEPPGLIILSSVKMCFSHICSFSSTERVLSVWNV